MELPEGISAVAVVVLQGEPDDEPEGLEIYRGVSYCEAVTLARRRPLVVRRSSIEVCKWSPAVLGLKPAENDFEKGLSPRLQPTTASLVLAPLTAIPEGLRPQVVILQGPSETLRSFLRKLGRESWAVEWASHIDKSALGLELGGLPSRKLGMISRVNRLLAALMPHPLWQRFTRTAFRSRALSRALEAAIKPFMASMSVCRNSTVIPLLGSAANLSFFCAGGITWGGNPSGHMTCGVPADLLGI
jgi:hypothetical protein